MPTVRSTAIQRIQHDEPRRRLSVWFESGEQYDYADVPRDVYEAFVSADSKGRYFAEHIRDHYPFEHRQ
jgi:hypothetical protein